ncbi:MAG: hypothetical protein AAF589_09500, partial [Planctomycetota bacterium]
MRIPPGVDVPVTPRVRRLIDTREFRRLSQISQLGLVGLVYPAANHTRHEHSLGVYRSAIEYVARLAYDQRFASLIEPPDAERFLVAPWVANSDFITVQVQQGLCTHVTRAVVQDNSVGC